MDKWQIDNETVTPHRPTPFSIPTSSCHPRSQTDNTLQSPIRGASFFFVLRIKLCYIWSKAAAPRTSGLTDTAPEQGHWMNDVSRFAALSWWRATNLFKYIRDNKGWRWRIEDGDTRGFREELVGIMCILDYSADHSKRPVPTISIKL